MININFYFFNIFMINILIFIIIFVILLKLNNKINIQSNINIELCHDIDKYHLIINNQNMIINNLKKTLYNYNNKQKKFNKKIINQLKFILLLISNNKNALYDNIIDKLLYSNNLILNKFYNSINLNNFNIYHHIIYNKKNIYNLKFIIIKYFLDMNDIIINNNNFSCYIELESSHILNFNYVYKNKPYSNILFRFYFYIDNNKVYLVYEYCSCCDNIKERINISSIIQYNNNKDNYFINIL